MNEQETREKIIKIIAQYVSAWEEDEAIADALISAWILDVKRHRVFVNKKNRTRANIFIKK